MVFEKRMKRKNLSDEILDDKNLNNIAVFPISIPLIVGPSALTLSVLISKNFNYTMLDFYTISSNDSDFDVDFNYDYLFNLPIEGFK